MRGSPLLENEGLCWIEVYENGAVGPDFGFPAKANRFAYLGSHPWPHRSWVKLILEWGKLSGEPVDDGGGAWARAYLYADDACRFVDAVFGSLHPNAQALKGRLRDEHKYIVFAMAGSDE